MQRTSIFVVLLVGLIIVLVLFLFNEYFKERRLQPGQPRMKSQHTKMIMQENKLDKIYMLLQKLEPGVKEIKSKNTEIAGTQSKLDQLLDFVASFTEKLRDFDLFRRNEKDFLKYKQQRNDIVKYLPALSQNTYNTTFHVLVDETEKQCNQRYKVIVLVSSNTPNFQRRQSIRDTWANKKNWRNHMWRVFFITGGTTNSDEMKRLYTEAETEKDVIIEDIPEDFYNMAKKVMIGLQWSHTNFKYDYILKCDDDVFVHMDNLVASLKDYHLHTYFGQAMHGQPVERQGRYGVSLEEWAQDHYDPYCSGGGFVLSRDVVHDMIPLFDWEKPLKIDDAYFGHLAYKTGSISKQGEGFYMWNTKCEAHKDMVVVHPAKEVECMNKLQMAANEKN